MSEMALLTAWLLTGNSLIQERIALYMTRWRSMQPITTGHTLRALGIEPGPCYSVLLSRLRTARLDGEVTSDAQEQALLQALIEEECHGKS